MTWYKEKDCERNKYENRIEKICQFGTSAVRGIMKC